MTDIKMPAYVKEILDTLHVGGYEAYIVGGCVRDALIGREPEDFDITTSAKPAEVQALFKRTVPTGIKHGTVTVLSSKNKCEVTTYRVDGEYEDSRHPKNVTFTASLEEDLKRRDFTVNALAWSDEDGLIDFFDGEKDLRDGVIRCVGDAESRFKEDALRIMRAFRFSAQLDFVIEEKTLGAAAKLSDTLSKISAERIHDELMKLITSGHPERIIDMYEAGVTKVFLPEFDALMETPQNTPWHCFNAGRHSVEAMRAIRNTPLLRLTMLLHDIAKPITRSTDEKGIDHFYDHPAKSADMAAVILNRLKFDNETKHRVCTLIRYHDFHVGGRIDAVRIRRVMHEIGREEFSLLLEVIEADNKAKSPEKAREKQHETDEMRRIYGEILKAGDAVALKELKVSGADLINAGITEGQEIGYTLEAMMRDVLKHPEHNEREFLLSEKQLKKFKADGKKEIRK